MLKKAITDCKVFLVDLEVLTLSGLAHYQIGRLHQVEMW